MAASLLLHAGVGLALFSAPAAPGLEQRTDTYRVSLVARAPEDAPVRARPAPAEAAEEEREPPPPQTTEEEKPEVEEPAEETEERPPLPSTEPARAPEEGEDAANVQIEGRIFPFPDYLNNIVRQVHRHWRPPTGEGELRAELRFAIAEDGSVTEIDWVQRSGDLAFDLEARGAIEAAGRRKAFGPLPEGYPRDRLTVTFYFDPSTR